MPAWEALGEAFAKEMLGYDYSTTIDAISAYEHAYSRPIMAEKMKKFLHPSCLKQNPRNKPKTPHKSECGGELTQKTELACP